MTAQRFRIAGLSAAEILDSRGRPTVGVEVVLAGGGRAVATVPAGASTGSHEAVELRDLDPARFGGQGVLRAVAAVENEIAEALCGRWWSSLEDVDATLCALDGTADKSRLGANAILGVSMAVARVLARSRGMALHEWLTQSRLPVRLPVPHFNVINGGAHAENGQAFQEFMIAPLGAPDLPAAVRAGAEIYQALRTRLAGAGQSVGLGDEGGFAPALHRPEDVLEVLTAAITDAGYPTGRDGIAIALDCAASGFHDAQGRYVVDGEVLSSTELIERYAQICARFPVWSIEDGLAEDDMTGWVELTKRLGDRVQLVGDDILVTNPARISAAISRGIGNAALIKPNQVGTVTETLEAMAICRSGGWAQMASHRSGETADTFIADLAVGTGCGQLKAGAPARGERVAKYNRLLQISGRQPAMPYGLADSVVTVQ